MYIVTDLKAVLEEVARDHGVHAIWSGFAQRIMDSPWGQRVQAHEATIRAVEADERRALMALAAANRRADNYRAGVVVAAFLGVLGGMALSVLIWLVLA